MNDQQLLARIVINSDVLVGKPVLKGTRLSVEYVLNLLAHGSTVEDILEEYPDVTHADIQACFLFATKALGTTTFMPLVAEPA